MGKIKTLKEEVFRKIAAGEVVERPLSVVKELVENAIDAGADEIRVDIMEGGKRSIQVSDNGEGFAPEDIETAFKRHSTSKISQLSDFDSLNTLGFRGEALPSILEVSKVCLRTSDNQEGTGLECRFEDNQLIHQEGIAFAQGTSIEIRDLFYNFPVRKKFLKSDRTEITQVISYLEQAALVNYHIAFSLSHNNRDVFSYNKTTQLKERLYQVFGKELLDDLQEVSHDNLRYTFYGFLSKLNTGVAVKKHQYFFVNRRPVRERTLIAALNNTYKNYLEKYKSPVAVVLLDIPPQEIDVNVHPMKLEIKFENTSNIYQFIKGAIDQSFGRSPDPLEGVSYGGYSGSSHRGSSHAPSFDPATPNLEAQVAESGGEGFSQSSLFDGNFYSEDGFFLLGQYKNSYIIIEKEETLMIVDQHNAQERVNFDRLKAQYRDNKIATINPLFPLVIELSASETHAMDQGKLELLAKIGFAIEPMGANAFDVKSFPQVLEEKSIKDAILTILHMDEGQGESEFEDRVLAEVACKSAIKINTPLHPEKMKTIVRELFKTGNPYFCPHKRPIIIDFTLDKIEKLMKRK